MGQQSSQNVTVKSPRELTNYSLERSEWSKFGHLSIDSFKSECTVSEFASSERKCYRNWKRIRTRLRKQADTSASKSLYNEHLFNLVRPFVKEGTPIQLARELLKQFFFIQHSDKQYSVLLSQIDVSRNPLPTFSTLSSSDILPKVYLTADGQSALHRLMLCLKIYHPWIQFAPELLAICSLLLVFVKESEAFFITSKLVMISKMNSRYFEMDLEKDIVWAELMQDYVRSVVPTLASFEISELITQITRSMFIGFFRLPCLLRILMCYLVEGKAFCKKLVLCMFCMIEQEISECECLGKLLVDRCFDLNSIDYLLEFSERKPVYVTDAPRIESSILTAGEFNFLWEELHPSFRLKNPHIIYSTKSHGMSLRALITAISQYSNRTPVLLVVESECRSVFGVFVDSHFRLSSVYTGGCESFLFRIKPVPAFWHSSGLNDMYACVSRNLLVFGGGGQGPGLTIDSDLLHCSSFKCNTYNNQPIQNYYKLVACELMVLTND